MNGGRITTFTQRRLDPFAPGPGDIDIRDIAHALALHCRFNGHCRTFYSVAEHSVRVSELLSGGAGTGPLALAGLMHDAAEAYLADVGGPIKPRFHIKTGDGLQTFDDAEEVLLRTIAEQLGFPSIHYADVRPADHTLLATEARDLFGMDARSWGVHETPLAQALEPWPWEEAERRFLQRYAELRASA